MRQEITRLMRERDEARATLVIAMSTSEGHAREAVAAMRRAEEIKEEITRLREEVAEYEHLAALQRQREAPWIARWQQEVGKPDTLPDYGELLAWIMGKALAQAAEARYERVVQGIDDALTTLARLHDALYCNNFDLTAEVARGYVCGLVDTLREDLQHALTVLPVSPVPSAPEADRGEAAHPE